MDPSEFTSKAAMTLRRQTTGYWAACPNKLPPALKSDWHLATKLSEADRALSELAGVGRTLPNPHLLIGPFIRKEAVLSSKIEGTQASLSDLLLFEASGGAEERTADVREVQAYIRALNYALETVKDLPISTRLFRQIHSILIPDPTKTPGELRISQNWIGPHGCGLSEASYVPPPADAVPEHLSDLERYLHEKGDLPPLVKYAIAHYQFECIHPFLDGNGRLGRLLITLLLCADPTLDSPLLPLPLLYLSAYFEQNRQSYYERLDAVSKHGRWLDWIVFFLEGVSQQSRDALRRSDRLLALKESFARRVYEQRGSALVRQISDQLFENPALTIPGMVSRYGRTYMGIKHAVAKLVALGIVSEVPSSPVKLFVAWDVVRAVEDPI